MDTEKRAPDDMYEFMSPEEKAETADVLIDALTDEVVNGYGVISLIHTSLDQSGAETTDRKNFTFIKTEAGAFEHNSSGQDCVDLAEFSSFFADSLCPTQQENNVLLLAVFDYLKMQLPEETHEDLKPEYVYQWVVSDGFISPDRYCNAEWKGVRIQPGVEFMEEGAEESTADNDDFELPDTSMALPFIRSLILNAPDGNNIISVVFSDVDEGYNSSVLPFNKSGELIVMDEPRGAMMVIDISSTLATGGHAGVALISYVDRKEEDGFEPNPDLDENKELRGWEISLGKGVYALNEEECLEAYCNDTETGETFIPEIKARYCAAWDTSAQ